MSKIIANLDAAIEAHRAKQGETERILRLFGRDWNLLPDISTATLNPILQVQALAEEAKTEAEQASVGLRSLIAIQETIVGSVIEEERAELRKALTEIGFPLEVLETVMESIMGAFTAAPLPTAAPTVNQTQTQEPQQESTTGSGNLSTSNGQTLSPVSTVPTLPSIRQRESGPELKPTTNPRWVGSES